MTRVTGGDAVATERGGRGTPMPLAQPPLCKAPPYCAQATRGTATAAKQKIDQPAKQRSHDGHSHIRSARPSPERKAASGAFGSKMKRTGKPSLSVKAVSPRATFGLSFDHVFDAAL